MKICLIGITHPSHNPRLIREADTLSEEGNKVTVIAPSYIPKLVQKDLELMKDRDWKLVNYDFVPNGIIGKFNFYRHIYLRKLFKFLQLFTDDLTVVEKSFVFALDYLTELAINEKADWYIAHTQGALPIAAKAAELCNAKLGYDCEDLLSENNVDPPKIVEKIETEYLKKCNYISTPSESISRFLVDKYKVNNPVVLYNVFPLNLAESIQEPFKRKINDTIKVHWMSQVISKRRGIQEAIQSMGKAGGEFELYLRGSISNEYKLELTQLCEKNNVRVYFLPQIKHDEIIKSMENYDVGLATETAMNSNFSKTVTNKVFSYMLAGLSLIATETPGQLEVLKNHPNIAYTYTPGNYEELIGIFRSLKDNPKQLFEYKQNSWELARTKYCWDIEKNKFLPLIN